MSLYLLKYRIKEFFSFAKTRFVLRWSFRFVILIFLMDTGYLIGIWPDWEMYSEGPVQRSNFIRRYLFDTYRHKSWPSLKWKPVAIDRISTDLVRAIVVAEDSRFYSHSGIDIDSFKKAMEYNLSKKRFVYGGSTISQQIVKNIFLSSSRNPLRKWHEFVLTLGMERKLTKLRILELYLNVAEFGRGVYGAEAASRYYWNRAASQLTSKQAIELAASLSAPVRHNPKTRTRYFKDRVKKISRYF